MESVKRAIEKLSDCLQHKHLTVLLDLSGSTYNNTNTIKQIAFEIVFNLSSRKNSSFNIIAFSNENKIFSNELVTCSNDALKSVCEWISGLLCNASTNTLSAIVAGFNDRDNQALILVTDNLPDQKPSSVVKCAKELSQGRPLHTIYVNNGHADTSVSGFLRELSMATQGTMHVITDCGKTLEYRQEYPEHFKVYSFCYDIGASSEASSEDGCNCDDCEDDKKAWRFRSFIGQTVLAKRSGEKHFSRGVVMQTEPSANMAIVSFPSEYFNVKERCLTEDLIAYRNPASDNEVCVGDHALVDTNSKNVFIPGEIYDKKYVYEDNEDSFGENISKKLLVKLHSGRIISTSVSQAICLVTKQRYNTIVRQLDEEILPQTSKSMNHEPGFCVKIDESSTDDDEDEEFNDLQLHRKSYSMRNHCKKNYHSPRCARKEAFISRSLEEDDCGEIVVEHNLSQTKSREKFNEKIERQLEESRRLLKSLDMPNDRVVHIKERNGNLNVLPEVNYDSGFAGSYEEIRKSIARNLKNRQEFESAIFSDSDVDESSDYKIKENPYRSLQARISTESQNRILIPTPPSTWRTAQRKHRPPLSQTAPKRRPASTVAANVVERSKKHWMGRPQNKDMSYINSGRTGKKFRFHKPEAFEYVTADGVPLNGESGGKFTGMSKSCWFPDARLSPYAPVQHRDIIGHRVVEYKPTFEPSRPPPLGDISSESKVTKIKRKHQCSKKRNDKEIKVRNDDVTKIKIVIENEGDKERVENRIQNENVKEKASRGIGKREKRREFADIGTNTVLVEKCSQTQRSRELRQKDFERKRIENKIDNHEKKIKRLKSLRQHTDARLQAYKRDNDQSRDMDNHVKDVQLANTRASILC